jgi:hypothetical protein
VVDGDFAIIHNQLNVMNCVDVVQWIAIENDQVCLKTGGIAPMSFEIPKHYAGLDVADCIASIGVIPVATGSAMSSDRRYGSLGV